MAIGKWLSVMLAAAMLSATGWAQKNPASIALDVVVTPKRSEAPVAGLTAQDFTVLDNGIPQKVTSFQALGGSNAPVEVVLVIDSEDAYYSTVAFERKQIEHFLRENGGRLQYPTQVAIFSNRGTQIQNGFTRDGNALSQVLDRANIGLREFQRSTGVYGAEEQLQLALKTMQEMTEHFGPMPGRKLVVWFSPGWPILSGPEVLLRRPQKQAIFQAIIALSGMMRQAQVTVYSIDPLGMSDAGTVRTFYYQNFVKGIRKPDQTQFGDLSLPVLATQTGGRVLNSGNDLIAQLQRVMRDAEAYYRLTFVPAAGEPNEYHKLEVKVDKPGLSARTRTGYYSE